MGLPDANPSATKSTTDPFHQLVRAARGTALSSRGWQQEAALRMLMNGLDPEVAERPHDLRVLGRTGKAVRDLESYCTIVSALKQLRDDETLIVKSGKSAGVIHTDESAPRILIAETNPTGRWSNPAGLRDLDPLGLMMFSQISEGSWIHVGAQGILQGTYETFGAAAQKHFGGDLSGKFVVSGGMGGMGGAQPLAATMNGAAFLGIEVDQECIKRRIRSGYCDICVNSLDEAIRILKNAVRKKQGVSVGVVGNCAEIVPELARRGIVPDLLTDQTSAHDPLNGYVPGGLSLDAAAELRLKSPDDYLKRSYESIARHVSAMRELQKLGSVAFDFGNGIRKVAADQGGVMDVYSISGFVPAYIQPLFDAGREPIRYVALSGEPADIYRIDDLLPELFPNDTVTSRWIRMARKFVKFQGLPARVCWMGREARVRFAQQVNNLVAKGELRAPVVVGHDQLTADPVASHSPNAEGPTDSNDALTESAELKALLNSASGISWVSLDQCGGSGAGLSQSIGLVTVADGTPRGSLIRR